MDASAADPSPSPPQPVREDGLWFQDATLIIQAEDRLFRVYPGILADKSPVFQDMLAFPQPEDGDTLDGCPLVRLTDSAVEATYFLKAIFHYDFFDAWPSIVEFDIVAGILRLSHKYQVDPLKKRALQHLSERCPTTPQQWDCDQEWGIHPIRLLNLAREVSADWILPLAFSSCSYCPIEHLLEGVPSPTGRACLSTSDIALCVHALKGFQTTWTSRLLDFLWNPTNIPHCTTPATCPSRRYAYRQEAERFRADGVMVLYLWDEQDWERMSELVCHACCVFMHDACRTAMNEFWDSLPQTFELPDWGVLETMRYRALA
ncbi:hypothetical protein C8J57DRAFT_65079 [Mycena rebaudengoi]|nr:hypothetical protein C8J57DRAFT_65079 [Mycena rebaudengoi]